MSIEDCGLWAADWLAYSSGCLHRRTTATDGTSKQDQQLPIVLACHKNEHMSGRILRRTTLA